MKGFFFALAALCVMGLAVWAYQQNYATQAALKEVNGLRDDIVELRERANVLRAEWAYLNRPERLADLADLNFDQLGLLPLRPDHFGRIEQVTYPIEPLDPITVPIEVMSRLEANQ